VGREKKKRRNALRSSSRREDDILPPSPPVSIESAPPSGAAMVDDSVPTDVPDFKESVVEYTRLIMAHTERRKVSRCEALATLRRVVRQRSLDTT